MVIKQVFKSGISPSINSIIGFLSILSYYSKPKMVIKQVFKSGISPGINSISWFLLSIYNAFDCLAYGLFQLYKITEQLEIQG